MKNTSFKNLMTAISNLSLVGKTKAEILSELGHGFNFYPDSVWTYIIGVKWWGEKTILLISFENDMVKSKTIKKTYRNVYQIIGL